MSRRFFHKIVGLAAVSAIFLCPFAEAQRLGGGGTARQAVQARPAVPTNLSAAQAHFGDSSVIHRNVVPTTPNTTRPAVQRPNTSPPANRPNFSGQNRQNVDRLDLNQARQNFGPDNREQIFNRADHIAVNRDGPDWKNWQNVNTQRINNTVINKINIDNRSINVIRNNFNQQNNRNEMFTGDWYARHPGAWYPGRNDIHIHVHPSHWWWGHPSWDNSWGWFAVGFFAGAVTNAVLTPVPYYYGSNIVYVQDTVYVNSVPYVSSSEYYRQAQSIAVVGTPPTAQPQKDDEPADEWLPMGTFAIVADGNQTQSKRILQIATNKQGQIRGNFINQETNTATELYGSVDPETQRVAFKAKDNDSLIAECGLWNLTQDTVPLLVHLDANRTEGRTLVRLTNEEET